MQSTGSSTLQGPQTSSPSSSTASSNINSPTDPNLNTTQVPSSMVAQIQQQVDPTHPQPLTSNGLWVGVLVTGSILFVAAGIATIAGFIMRWHDSTTS